MEDFIPQLVNSSFPTLKNGLIATSIRPERKMALIGAEDQGKLIAEAFSNPEGFDKKEIPLAGDSLTMGEIAEIISKVTGKKVESVTMTAEEFQTNKDVVAAFDEVFGEFSSHALSGTVESYEWDNNDGYTADVAEANSYGVRMSTFREWCIRHKKDFVID